LSSTGGGSRHYTDLRGGRQREEQLPVAARISVGRPSSAEALLINHRRQGRACAPLGVANRSVAFTQCGQQLDRQPLEQALPVGTFLAQYRLGIQRRPPAASLTAC
jgi:hypothetical protein